MDPKLMRRADMSALRSIASGARRGRVSRTPWSDEDTDRIISGARDTIDRTVAANPVQVPGQAAPSHRDEIMNDVERAIAPLKDVGQGLGHPGTSGRSTVVIAQEGDDEDQRYRK